MAVRYGIIGCGAIGQRRHIPEGAANADAKVVAVCDINRPRVEEVAKKFGAQAFVDYKQMLKSAEIDAVVVGTPNYLHAPQTIDSLKAGKHVLVEKPMATSRQEALAMIKAAEKAKKFLMVGQNQRLMPAHVRAKEILGTGRLGKVLSFRTSFKHGGPENWSLDGNKSWFFRKDEAVMGVTGDLGIHKADLMRWLLDDEFMEVGGILATLDKKLPNGRPIELDDNACLAVRSRKGVIGTIEISWTLNGGEDNMTVIYCKNGVMKLGCDPVYGVMVDYRGGDREMHKVGAMATNTKQVGSGIIDAFTRSILTNKRPEIDGWEGYKSMVVIITGMEAARAGKVMRVK